MLRVVFIGWVLLFAYGCAVERNDYSYGYYTGIKNPRVKRHDTAATTVPESDVPSVPSSVPSSGYHQVSKGETLYSIAWQYGHDVREVAIWNNIRPPYTIYPRQQIRVTRPSGLSTRRVPNHPPSAAHTHSKTYTPKRPASPSHKNTAKSANRGVKITWQWPTKGKIIGKYSAQDSGKKGLDIAGKPGQQIYAAADGDIVYSGGGLRGYGKLIIIKHNDTYLSAYAHNKRLHVKEDQKVKKGQHIADMGSSEANRPMLHFEVRRNGKPVNPLRYLPRRR